MLRQTFKVTSLPDRHAFIKLPGRRIAFITKALTRPGKNGRRARVVSAYFGFATQEQAQSFVTGLRRYFPKAFCQIRAAQRLTTAIEVKVRDFPALEAFLWQFAANTAIVFPTAVKADLQQTDYPAAPARANVVSFTDRSNAPLAHRSPPRHIAGIAID